MKVERKRQTKDYKTLEAPAEDEFLWCDDCNAEYQGDCPQCGPLTVINDRPVPEGDPCMAKKSLPPKLRIDRSSIHGDGVFATRILGKRYRFGPYKGVRIRARELKGTKDSGYAFQIKRGEKITHYIDAGDESKSNWMRYVNCARFEEEQNVCAFQYKDEIYYRTLRIIKPNEELLVWYGDSYAALLGINSATDRGMRLRSRKKNNDENQTLDDNEITFKTEGNCDDESSEEESDYEDEYELDKEEMRVTTDEEGSNYDDKDIGKEKEEIEEISSDDSDGFSYRDRRRRKRMRRNISPNYLMKRELEYEEGDPEKKCESTPRYEREIQSLNGNVSDGNRTESSAEVSDASTINFLSQDDKRETKKGLEPSDGKFVRKRSGGSPDGCDDTEGDSNPFPPSMAEKKAKQVISLSNHSESEGGHESETKLNATVSSDFDSDDYQLMRKELYHEIMKKRKKRIMDSDSDPSSGAEFMGRRKKGKFDAEASSQNEYESSEDDSIDKKKTGQKKTFKKKWYHKVTKSNFRNYSSESDDNSEKVSCQSESDKSDQRGKSKNNRNSKSDPDDTSDDEEKRSRRECDSRHSESGDKDDSTSQESSDSDQENKTKSRIKNGIKVTSRIPRHFRKRSRRRRPRSPTDSERTDTAEEGTTRKVSGMKEAERYLSWFVDQMLEESQETTTSTTTEGHPVTKIENWHKCKRAKTLSLEKERSELQIKLQKTLNECEIIRVQLEQNLRELEQNESSCQLASKVLLFYGKSLSNRK